MKDIYFSFDIANLNPDWWFDISRTDNLDLTGANIENINVTGGSGVFIQGTVSFESEAVIGPSNRTVASFDTNNSQRYLALGITSDPGNSFELTCVASTNVAAQTSTMFSQNDGTGTGRAIMSLKSNGVLTSFLGGVNTDGTTNASGAYHVFAFRHNPITNIFRLYVDGALENSQTRNFESATGEWVLGANKNQTGNFFDGEIAEGLLINSETPDVIFNAYQQHLCAKWGIEYKG